MIHESGIQVYLQPARPATLTPEGPYKELELAPPDDHGERYKRCFILYADEPFKLVLKIPETVDLYGASAVHIAGGIGAKPSVCGPTGWLGRSSSPYKRLTNFHYNYLPRAYTIDYTGSEKYRLVTRKESGTLQDDEDSHVRLTRSGSEQTMELGAISVCLQLGHVQRTSEGTDKSATNVPKDSRHQVLYRGGSFVPLSGSAGAKILFQFRLRSQVRLDEVEKAVSTISGRLECQLGTGRNDGGNAVAGGPNDPDELIEKVAGSDPPGSLPAQVQQTQLDTSTSAAIHIASRQQTPQICGCNGESCENPNRKAQSALGGTEGKSN